MLHSPLARDGANLWPQGTLATAGAAQYQLSQALSPPSLEKGHYSGFTDRIHDQ